MRILLMLAHSVSEIVVRGIFSIVASTCIMSLSVKLE